MRVLVLNIYELCKSEYGPQQELDIENWARLKPISKAKAKAVSVISSFNKRLTRTFAKK